MARLSRGAALLLAASAIAALGACRESEPPTKGFPPGAVPPSSSYEVLRGCPAPKGPVEEAPKGDGRIVVTGEPRQRMEGWGASVVTDTPVDPLVNPKGLSLRQVYDLDRRVFRDAGVNLIRVFGPGYGFYEVLAARPAQARDPRLRFMQRVKRYGVRFMFTGAQAPAPFKAGKTLAAGREDDYARYIAGYLRFARDVMKVPFDYAAIANEPDNRRSLLVLTPPQAAAVYRALADELRTQGLATKLVLGDTTGWGTACPYADRLLRDDRVTRGAAAFASHSYFGTSAEARAVSELAAARDLPVWQTEFGTGCAECPDDDSMHGAIRWARQIVAALTKAQATAWFAFRPVADATHGPGDALLVRDAKDPGRPYYASRRFEVFRQYSTAAPPGARRLVVRDSLPETSAVAFGFRGRLSVVVTNASRRPQVASLELGARRGTVSARRTSATQRFAPQPRRSYKGRALRVALPPESVTTYVLEPGR